MSKKRLPIILVLFFLVQELLISPVFSLEGNQLNTPTKVNVNSPDTLFSNIYHAVCLGVFLYEQDAVMGISKETIIEKYGGLSFGPNVKFDLSNIDMVRKGWTRYYPFSIGNKTFIMRIFLTAERIYQSSVPILYEGAIASPAVTFQVLPSLNEILADHKIRPRPSFSSPEIDHST